MDNGRFAERKSWTRLSQDCSTTVFVPLPVRNSPFPFGVASPISPIPIGGRACWPHIANPSSLDPPSSSGLVCSTRGVYANDRSPMARLTRSAESRAGWIREYQGSANPESGLVDFPHIRWEQSSMYRTFASGRKGRDIPPSVRPVRIGRVRSIPLGGQRIGLVLIFPCIKQGER